VNNLTRAAKPNFSRNEIVYWLESQDAYTLHRPTHRKFHDCITAWRMLTMYGKRIWSNSEISKVTAMVILIYWWLLTYSANMP